MYRLLSFAVSLALFLTINHAALAEKYTCKGDGYEARIGASPIRRVTIEFRREKHHCYFSIDGWPANSPPSDSVQSAFQQLRAVFNTPSGTKPPALGINTLAYSLAAASPETEVSRDLAAMLKENIGTIQRCTEDFIQYEKMPPYQGLKPNSVACGAFEKGHHELARGVTMDVVLGSKALVIGTESKGVIRILVIVFSQLK